MKEKVSKLFAVIAFVSTLAVGNLAPLTASAAPDTCTWVGASGGFWATAANWSGCDNGGVPENGDSLVFPAGASNTIMNNNLSSLSVESITFNGGGYLITGNDFTITGITAITANQSASISANVTYNSGSHVNIYPAAGTTLSLGGVSNFALSSFYEVNIGSSSFTGNVTFNGNITGSAASQFIVQNGAHAIVNGSTNTYTATTVGAESNGVFECNSATCFGDNANSIYMGGGTVQIGTSATFSNNLQTSTTTSDVSRLTANNDVSITGSSSTVNDDLRIDQLTASKSLQLTGSATLNGNIDVYGNSTSSNVKFDGVLSGAGNVNVHSGNAWMSASNTFTGVVTIMSGAVAMADQVNSLGATSGNTVVQSGGSLMLDTPSATTIAEPINVVGTGVGPNSYKGAIYVASTSNDVALSGNIALAGNSTVYNDAVGKDLSLNGAISGTGNLTLTALWDPSDSGSITFGGGSANTYNGDTTVNGGTVYFQKTGAIPANLTVETADTGSNRANVYFYTSSNVMSNSGVVTMGPNTIDHLTFGANNEIIGGLKGTGGVVQIQTDGDKVIIDQSTNTTYAGSFYTDGNIGTFEKKGTGTLTLTGNYQNSSDKITFVASEGALSINGNVKTTNGGNVSVNGGKLKGTGTVNDLSTSGGTVAPGNSPGKLTVGSLTLDPTNTLEIEIDGNVSGTSYDVIESSGAVNLAGATLSVKPSYTPSAGQVFTIITGTSVTGTFKDRANNSTFVVDGITFRINYGSTSVTLTYVSGSYDPSGSLANTGTSMMIAAAASLMLIGTSTVLATRKRSIATPSE